MNDMGVIGKHSLQRVLSGRKLDSDLALTHVQMNVVFALRDRLVWVGRRSINNQMMMTSVRPVSRRWCESHLFGQTELN